MTQLMLKRWCAKSMSERNRFDQSSQKVKCTSNRYSEWLAAAGSLTFELVSILFSQFLLSDTHQRSIVVN